jgi:hypothetical protein
MDTDLRPEGKAGGGPRSEVGGPRSGEPSTFNLKPGFNYEIRELRKDSRSLAKHAKVAKGGPA